MNTKFWLLGVLALAQPTIVTANELEWSGEAGVNVANSGGASETTGTLIMELSYGGAFIGGEVETLYRDPADDAEITLTLGYSFDIGTDMVLAASYSRIYLDKSGFSSHEAALALDFPITQNIGGTIEVIRALTGKTTDVSLATEFGLGNGFTGEALVGHDGSANYGEAGLSYDLRENVSIGYLVELAEGAKPVHNFGITFGFGS